MMLVRKFWQPIYKELTRCGVTVSGAGGMRGIKDYNIMYDPMHDFLQKITYKDKKLIVRIIRKCEHNELYAKVYPIVSEKVMDIWFYDDDKQHLLMQEVKEYMGVAWNKRLDLFNSK